MELSAFSENIVTIPYLRNGESVNLEVNIDVFTPEFFRQVGRRFEERRKAWTATDKVKQKPKGKADEAKAFFETQAQELEIKREIYAELLAAGVLKGWDITENGIPISPSYEVLMRLPPLLVEDIWNLSLERAKTVKKREDVEIEATLENMPSGSRVLHAVGQTG